MIFFLFPVVGMYSFIFFIFFIPCSSSSLLFLPLPIQNHTHINFFPNSNSFSISLSTTKKSKMAKKKREKENKKRIYNEFQHVYTLQNSLFPTHSHVRQIGIETSQLSSAQLNFVIKIVKNLLRLYISLFFLGFESNRGGNSSEGTPFFT